MTQPKRKSQTKKPKRKPATKREVRKIAQAAGRASAAKAVAVHAKADARPITVSGNGCEPTFRSVAQRPPVPGCECCGHAAEDGHAEGCPERVNSPRAEIAIVPGLELGEPWPLRAWWRKAWAWLTA